MSEPDAPYELTPQMIANFRKYVEREIELAAMDGNVKLPPSHPGGYVFYAYEALWHLRLSIRNWERQFPPLAEEHQRVIEDRRAAGIVDTLGTADYYERQARGEYR